MNATGNRACRVLGCGSYGGSQYMDWHETLSHGRCMCGWIGAVKNLPWHRRHVGGLVLRGQHFIVETFREDEP